MKAKNTRTVVRTTPIFAEPARMFILDLIGPYVVQRVGKVFNICAPICPDHHANVLTDTDDVSLEGLTTPNPKGYVYGFKRPDSPRSAVLVPLENDVLVLDRKSTPIKAGTCHLIWQVPIPNKIVGLHPEPIFIHRNGATPWIKNHKRDDEAIVNGKHARGLRFVYQYCRKEPEMVVSRPSRKSSEQSPSICCKSLGMDPSAHFSMTLRFANRAAASDDNHQDAYRCFQEMRQLIKGTFRWRVDFDPCKEDEFIVDNLGGHHPTDCGAAVLVLL